MLILLYIYGLKILKNEEIIFQYQKSETIHKFTLNLHIKKRYTLWLSLIDIEEIIIPLQAGITPLHVPLVVQVLILEPFNSIV